MNFHLQLIRRVAAVLGLLPQAGADSLQPPRHAAALSGRRSSPHRRLRLGAQQRQLLLPLPPRRRHRLLVHSLRHGRGLCRGLRRYTSLSVKLNWSLLSASDTPINNRFAGGYISDRVVVRLGLHSRLWLLGLATVLATPFAALTLHLDPPAAFGTLLLYYFFG